MMKTFYVVLRRSTSDAFVSRITSSRPVGGISRWGHRSFLAAAEQACSLIACSTLSCLALLIKSDATPLSSSPRFTQQTAWFTKRDAGHPR